jgi:hypothetical protein
MFKKVKGFIGYLIVECFSPAVAHPILTIVSLKINNKKRKSHQEIGQRFPERTVLQLLEIMYRVSLPYKASVPCYAF